METQIYGFLVTQLDGTPPDNMINLQPSKGNIETQLDGLPGTRLVDMTYSQPDKENIAMQFDGFHGTDDMISSPYSEAVNIEFIEVCSEESEDMDRCEEGNLREKKNILKKRRKTQSMLVAENDEKQEYTKITENHSSIKSPKRKK